MTTEHLAASLALVGLVILVSSLLSGAVERSGLPQVAIFLALGAALGPVALGLVDFPLESPALHVLATLALMLVLFTDAISVDVAAVRRQPRLALAVLGPGTVIPAALIALAAWWLLGLTPPAAAILGAALGSTDPVLLRTLLRHPALPEQTRLALRLESGMNDVVLLPVIVLSMLLLAPGGATAGEIGRHSAGLFLLGPALGVAIGWGAIRLLELVRRRAGVRRDYESLYALGVALTAFAAAEAAGGSGFLAAFAAGLVIAALDVELCDCFLDYGEATAEMFLLLTFVAFGASLLWTGLTIADLRTLVFAAMALTVRTVVLFPVLARAGVNAGSRRQIALLGPRGLSSLLLVLLPVFAGVPGAERLFTIACLVVLLSVVLHGGGIALFLRRTARGGGAAAAAESPPSQRSAPNSPREAVDDAGAPEPITIPELRAMWERGESPVIVDARTERTYGQNGTQARGAVRIPPDDAVPRATDLGLANHATLVIYCA
ncbi:MAG: cation:proton antiporter [Gemmatimonadota bacterium]|nr:cation:proton antiporter [Gemmatimonadota bacterium]